jgi:hypothetical protein
MKLKSYIQFINENKIEDFDSLGEWVESLIDDEYVKNIVIRYTKDIDPTIRLANAINILEEDEKKEMKRLIQHYLQNGIEEKEPQFTISTDLEPLTESEVGVAGKGIFTSFLKCLTSLGQKEKEADFKNCPNNFLIFYFFPNLDSQVVKQIFTRFRSLTNYLDLINYQENQTNLYFGIKCDGQFEYGISYQTLTQIGQFKLSKSIMKWICQIESKSASSLKKQLVNLTYQDIINLGQIKSDLLNFNPGYHESKLPVTVSDRIISIGYFGVGKWDNGKLDEGELNNVKSNFSTFALSKRWGDKILISIKPESFWVKIHIKLK